MYEELIFYQIYPKSFCDSDMDGLGDIQGIIDKADYLSDLGVNAVWLSPCFKSPNVDGGYDISDYRDIMDGLGTMDDFKRMIDAFHSRNIKIIVDFVANHTSTEHRWFKEALRSRDNPYHDYYIWFSAPPNRWESAFGGSAWEYAESVNEYYLHSYAVEQADLNWENPAVREEMKAVLDFWIAAGVDGFRCDVLDQISKDFYSENGNGNGKNLHAYIRELFDREGVRHVFRIGECWFADEKNIELFCKREREELSSAFIFRHLCLEKGRYDLEKISLCEVVRRISHWQNVMQKLNIPYPLFLENHDQARSVSRMGDDGALRYECATCFAGIILLHKGIPFLYQGEEIGVTNSNFSSIADFNDADALGYYRANKDEKSDAEIMAEINYGSRDNARRMMPWTAGDERNYAVGAYSERERINVETDLSAQKSVYKFYRRLIRLRKDSSCLTCGEYKVLTLNEHYYAFERKRENERIIVVICFERAVNFDISHYGGTVIVNNYPDIGEKLQPYQLLVLKG
ncbi:MAG: glucohydrolase [Bacillota bacterium]|nr:MAG: glucohydrolase [Bacillota bacterium]